MVTMVSISSCKESKPIAEGTLEETSETNLEKETSEEASKEESPKEKSPVLIGYSAPSLTEIAQVTIQQGMLDGAAALGFKTITANANYDVQKQINDVDNLITMGVSAIVLVPADSTAITPAVKKCNELGIPVFSIDRAPLEGKVELNITSDNYIAGKQIAEHLVKLLIDKYGNPKGKVFELQLAQSVNVGKLRSVGFTDVLKEYPDIEVIQYEEIKRTIEDATNAMQDTLTKHPDIDAVYVGSEYYGIGIKAALEQTNRLVPADEEGHIIFLGIDGTPEALEWIRDGYMDATASQPLYDFGILCARYIQKYLNGEEIKIGEVVEEEGALWSPATIAEGDVGPQLLLSTTLVTKDNVDDKGLWANVLKVE